MNMSAMCANDSLDDLQSSPEIVDAVNIFLIPLRLQVEARDTLGNAKVLRLTTDQATRFVGRAKKEELVPYLVRACMVTVSLQNWDTLGERLSAEEFVRAVKAGNLKAAFFPDERTLLLQTFGLAPSAQKPGPIFYVIWSAKPVEEVRVMAGGAS